MREERFTNIVRDRLEVKSDLITNQLNAYESNINSKWRPMMAWLYMATCAFDFIIAPILWSAAQGYWHHALTQWSPITLQGGALYHLAMGAIIGITSYSKSQERLNAMSIYATVNPNYEYPNKEDPK